MNHPKPVYASMSIDNLFDALQTMSSVRRTFHLQACLGGHYPGGKPISIWAEKMAEDVEAEMTRMVREIELREPKTDDEATIRDQAVGAQPAVCQHQGAGSDDRPRVDSG